MGILKMDYYNMLETTTMEQLAQWIKRRLGEPNIQVEVTDYQMFDQIHHAVETFTNVAYGSYEQQQVIQGKDQVLKHCKSVLRILNKEGTREYSFRFDPIRRKIEMKEDVPCEVLMVYIPKFVAEEVDYIYDEQWVKEYSLNLVKRLWGETLGKYENTLVSGVSLNFDRIISEAQSEIDRLNEELFEKWYDPAPVLVG